MHTYFCKIGIGNPFIQGFIIMYADTYMAFTRSPLPRNNGNLPLPSFGGNYPIILLDNIYYWLYMYTNWFTCIISINYHICYTKKGGYQEFSKFSQHIGKLPISQWKQGNYPVITIYAMIIVSQKYQYQPISGSVSKYHPQKSGIRLVQHGQDSQNLILIQSRKECTCKLQKEQFKRIYCYNLKKVHFTERPTCLFYHKTIYREVSLVKTMKVNQWGYY